MKNYTGKDLEPSRNWDQTSASRVIPGITTLHLRIMPKKFARCSSFHVQNGEECEVNNWVIVKANDGYYYVAKVTEILHIPGSETELSQQPSYIVVLLHLFLRGGRLLQYAKID